MGGNSDKPAAPAAPAPLPAMTSTGPTQTFPAAMPGQLDALSQQLSAGYGGKPADIMSMLQSIYSPMTVGGGAAAAAPAVGRGGATTPPVPLPTTPYSGGLPNNLMVKNGRTYKRTSSGGYVPLGLGT